MEVRGVGVRGCPLYSPLFFSLLVLVQTQSKVIVTIINSN